MSSPTLYVGLMSGTSLDGIDCCLVDFAEERPHLLASALRPFPDLLKQQLLSLQRPAHDEIHLAELAANGLAHAYADAVTHVLGIASVSSTMIRAIGMHGQTIRHRPDCGYTTQIGNAALLAELSDIDVVANFRTRDVAAGGQGAPLVPAFHVGMFGANVHRVIVNIGGIANLTDLPTDGKVRGWDTGPGNVLMNEWVERHLGQAFDADGAWAQGGRPVPELLDTMLQDAYFKLPPPKSTGRDLFHMTWLKQAIGGSHFAPQDVQATLLELTAQSIARSLLAEAPNCSEVYICGGGARNGAMMCRLGALLAPRFVSSTESLGLHPDWVEAVAFAWLARQSIARKPGNLADVTGARGPRVLGAIYPR